MTAPAANDVTSIHNLVASYFARVDRPGLDRAADLFAKDAEFVLGNMTLRGRAGIAAYFEERNRAQATSGRTTRHFVGGIELTTIDGARMAGRMTTVVFAGEGTLPLPAVVPSTIGDFDDIYVRADGNWLFERRVAAVVFIGGNAPAFAKS